MNFEIILSFFILGVLKSFILSMLSLIFPILVISFYQKTTLVNVNNLDIILGSITTLGFNYLTFTNKIERSKLLKLRF